MTSHLVGEGNDASEFRSGLARSARRVPARRLALEALVHVGRAIARAAHGDVRDATTPADHSPHAVLVPRPTENDRLAAAAGQRVRPLIASDVYVRRHAEGIVPDRRPP